MKGYAPPKVVGGGAMSRVINRAMPPLPNSHEVVPRLITFSLLSRRTGREGKRVERRVTKGAFNTISSSSSSVPPCQPKRNSKKKRGIDFGEIYIAHQRFTVKRYRSA